LFRVRFAVAGDAIKFLSRQPYRAPIKIGYPQQMAAAVADPFSCRDDRARDRSRCSKNANAAAPASRRRRGADFRGSLF